MNTGSDSAPYFTVDRDNQRFGVDFDIKYYNADQGGDAYVGSGNNPSGAYLFKPAKNQTDSYRYSNLTSVTVYNGTFVQEIQLVFSNFTTSQNASVRITTFNSPAITVWEVVLYGIPLSDQGKEVTANWKSYNISHNGTFYTDSNALEMQ